MSKNILNIPGPGDFDPPDPPEAYTECEQCGKEFCYNPEDYKQADDDGFYYNKPLLCPSCVMAKF